MKKVLICLMFSVALLQSCKKEDYSIVISYNELYINPVEGNTVVLDLNPSGYWDSYQSTEKEMAKRAQLLIDEKVEKIVVDIDGKNIVSMNKL